MKRHNRSRSASNSPAFIISDDDSPIRKSRKVHKHSDSKHSHKKHHKHHKHRDVVSDDETYGSSQEVEKSSKYKGHGFVAKIKEEPSSDTERERKHRNKHSSHSRPSDSRSKSKAPIKEEPQSDVEPEWGKKEIKTEKKDAQKNNAKPDFGLSGKLTEDTNTFNGVVVKYSEPPDARKPKRRWRLYPFKGENSLPVLHIHRQSAYLMGRDRKVADIPIDHPSCSKQHAALQYRLVPFKRADGSSGRQIKLYVIDLESANGTYLNNKKIEPKKYYELKERDVVKFGYSSREYVLLHEHSKDSENDDDVLNDE